MIRLGLFLGALGVAAGCSSTGKVVVQDGYRGTIQPPPAAAARRPGALTLAPEGGRDATAAPTAAASAP